jgi:predicted negative regulator of RcsB-dependent stress response
MAYDLEEQEQIASIKAWWKEQGTRVVTVIAIAAFAVAGWRGWDWYQRSQAHQAGALYESVIKAAQAGDAKALRDASGALAEGFPRTLHAAMGALVSARFYFDRNDLKGARAQLQWVLDRSPHEDFRDLARLRLAAVLLDETSYDEALRLLQAKHAAAYEAQYAALRGDVLVAKNQAEEAKKAYRLALDKAAAQDGAFRESLRMRIEALGG